MTIVDIVSEIKQNTKQYKPILIAIEGFGGSGKTTFAEKLRDALCNAYVVSVDDFTIKEKLAEQSWDNGIFDRDRLERQVLIPATSDQNISYQKLIWGTNTLSDPVVVPTVDYLIVEGISSFHPDIAKYYDYKIWIDVPIEIAKQRGKLKDAGNENANNWDLWVKNDLAYQQKYHPEQQADLVIDNNEIER